MKKIDFDKGSLAESILKTALPLLVAQVLSLLYSIVDRIYIARIPGSGTIALGAVGLCFPIIIIITGFTNMFGMGGGPLFAIELGKKNREKAADILNTSFRMLVVLALLITFFGEVFGRSLLTLFGATSEELPISLAYLRIYLVGTLFHMTGSGMGPFLNAQGFSMISMASVVAGAGANLVLDPLFIFVFGMGVQGAAAATVLSQLLAMLVVFRFLYGGKNLCRPGFQFRFPYVGQIAGLGVAPFIMQATNSLVQIACNSVLMHFGGASFVSIMTIVSSVRSILDTPVMALTEGTSPVLSYNYGARRMHNVIKGIRLMTLLCLAYTAAVWVILFLRPVWFVRIFTNDREILAPCTRALHLYFYAFVFQTLQYSGQTVFKALNKRRQAIFFSLLRKAVLVVPLTYLLPYAFGLGTDGVFLAEPVSNVIGGTACFVTMVLTMRREEGGAPAASAGAE